MPKINLEWLEKQKNAEGENKPDGYVLAILKIGEKVLDFMDEIPETEAFDADALISKADEFYKEGITGNMAYYVAMIAVKCHSRGEEFRKSFNAHWGEPNAEGLINPAMFSIG